MKHLILITAGIFISTTAAYAAPEDFIGTFKGTDKSTLTNCGAYNGTGTSPWTVKYANLKGNQFVSVLLSVPLKVPIKSSGAA